MNVQHLCQQVGRGFPVSALTMQLQWPLITNLGRSNELSFHVHTAKLQKALL